MDDSEVRDFISNGSWDEAKLFEALDDSLVEYITSNLSPYLTEEPDPTWWMPRLMASSPTALLFRLSEGKRRFSGGWRILDQGGPLQGVFPPMEDLEKKACHKR